jgi:hypothetical protein
MRIHRLAFLLFVTPIHAAPDCASCHRNETHDFPAAGMTRALVRANASTVLRDHAKLTAKIGGYSYAISDATLTVGDGGETLRVPLEWAFGEGSVGQTYLFRIDGRWYESRVSYFATLPGLDLTLGFQNIPAHSLTEAAGRPIPIAEATRCFDCHATNVAKSRPLDTATIVEGVQCERCHGPTEAHLKAVAGGPPARLPKLSTLSTEDLSDLCGQCHRTWSQIAANGPRGIQDIRFQPYRLALSKCYDANDARIRCTACHNPHRPLETTATAYDTRCLGCHSTAAQGTKAAQHICRVDTKNCVTCHMPRLELPGSHRRFADHKIRIGRAGEEYPD